MILNDKSSGAQNQASKAVNLALTGFQRPALPPLGPSTPPPRTSSTLSDQSMASESPKDSVAPLCFSGPAASLCFCGSAASLCFSGSAASSYFRGSAASFRFSGSSAPFRYSGSDASK